MAKSRDKKESATTVAAAAAATGDADSATLKAGVKVLIDGIKSRPEVNGQVGTIVEYLPERERYSVRLAPDATHPAGEELALKMAVLTLQE